MTKVLQNIRTTNGDEKCLKAYGQYLFWSRKAKSHSGPITAMTYRDMAGRAVAEERGLTDEQVLGSR